MILLDTCAAIWFADGASHLNEAAQTAVKTAAQENHLAISAITAWEIATLVRRGRLRLSVTGEEYVKRLFELPGLREVPIDRRIATRAGTLAAFHGDPADRLVVATAIGLKATVCTRDRRILEYAGPVLSVLAC